MLDALFADGMDGDPVASYATNAMLESADGPFSNVKLIFASHIHEDHMKAKPILRHLRANEDAKVILPNQASIFMKAGGVGGEGERISYADVKVGEVRDLENFPFPVTLYGLSHGQGNEVIENLGIKITVGGKTIMHVGDMYGEQQILEKIKVDYLILPFWYMSTPERVENIKSVFDAAHIIPSHFALDASEWMQSMGGLDKVRTRTFAAMDNLIQLDQEMQCINFK
ncbi:MAG: MBL fold metallo-hydrolase [Emcibacteraceae bacterium]|nr:MBL fold metallo-hydrolase [Emcibacteraceae bacterium]